MGFQYDLMQRFSVSSDRGFIGMQRALVTGTNLRSRKQARANSANDKKYVLLNIIFD